MLNVLYHLSFRASRVTVDLREDKDLLDLLELRALLELQDQMDQQGLQVNKEFLLIFSDCMWNKQHKAVQWKSERQSWTGTRNCPRHFEQRLAHQVLMERP
ncbi:hypothetical protein ILYODFUR_028603 [Ilyodon furcidens]|uniref:Uncharacterized protein n=1 Tax=Ilyodon furcidens TaxID=33524 RepID=A0ABV0T245_9TELE